MLRRLPMGLLIALIMTFVAMIVLAIVSAILPEVNIDVVKWSAVFGLLCGLVHVVSGKEIVQ